MHFKGLRFSIIFSMIIISGYIRGYDLPLFPSSSYLIVISSFFGILSISILVVQSYNIIVARKRFYWWCWFTVFVIASFIYNILIYPYPISSIKFFSEISFTLVLIFIPVYLLDDGLLVLIYRLYVPVSALVSCVFIFVPILNGTTEIRRVGGGAFRLSGAVNNIALMFTIAIAIAIIGILFLEKRMDKNINYISLCLLVPGLLVTGSRRMIVGGGILILGLLIMVGWMNSVAMWKKVKKISMPVLISLVGVFIIFDFTGVSRYSVGSIIRSLVIRITGNYAPVINQIEFTAQEIMFGAGMFRYGLVAPKSATAIVYPHNFILSFFAHTGIITTILLFSIVTLNIRYLSSSIINSNKYSQYILLSTLIPLLLILIFMSLGGRITRTFIFYIFIGISEYLYISGREGISGPLLINEYK